jgi:hypothetical protein
MKAKINDKVKTLAEIKSFSDRIVPAGTLGYIIEA